MRKTHTTYQCRTCGTRFVDSKRVRKYCSHLCYTTFNKGENNARRKNGTRTVGGYILMTVDGKRVYQHRHVMERHLGRPLLSSEHVHHINHDRADNRIENLELVASNSEHRARCHASYRNDEEKQCTRCRAVKPRTEFYRRPKAPGVVDTHHSRCAQCCRELAAEYRKRKQARASS